ncbi:E3 ubiquitin-protein ligase E3D [Desmophyllum pertusum]|uniref:E3 ubiquitin-protein ligase E3D n=1 Tax=Desmophyllum pertusum TaxID=174260 RepID=A0A9X0CXZ0_9CNID|nr:E3 ubiquitin-protein ligase E3D [Desmophyllum pertusum]
MADDSSVLPIWCDVGKNLNAAYMVVSLGDVTKGRPTYDGNSKQIVQIYSRYLTFDGHEFSTAVDANSEGDRNTVRYPAAFSVIPRTCSGLSICGGNEVQMRLQFEYHTSDSQEGSSKTHLKEELRELRSGCHSVCCRICGSAVLLPEMQFNRVLELPSENWFELSQDWCCHGSSHLTSVAGVLEPSEKDCFVGEYYIKLHPSAVEPGSLQISAGEEHHLIKCCRCNTIIGNVRVESSSPDVLEFSDASSIYLYKHRISLRCSTLFRSYCVETFISSCLISKSQGAVNFRFLVQEPVHNGRRKTHACLWLFNADTAVITNVVPGNFDSLKTAIKTGIYSVRNRAKYLHVLKILYKIEPLLCSSDWDDEVDAWQDNSSVQSVTFTKETCQHLILLLVESTNTIAPSLRDMNGFKVGYLRTLKT